MENEKSKLYVGNLVYSTGFREVKDLFAKYGQVGYVKIIEGKGFGFVEMASEEDAIKAKEALNGFEFGGRKLKVDFATPKAPKEQQ
jgi:RNA recognition motif-containing protein